MLTPCIIKIQIMKKLLSLTIIFCCVLAMPVVAAMKSNPANNNASQNNKSDLFRPMHATNIKIAKKIPASLIIGETKGKPSSPPGQDEEDDFSGRTATGFLGTPLVDGAKKYAVVIGICDYPEDIESGVQEIDDICLSDGDSYNMVTALIENYGYDPENIYWFRDRGNSTETISGNEISYGVPTHENIKAAITGTTDTLGIKDKAVSGDEVVFFFSGHGTSGEVVDGTVGGEDDDENNAENLDEGLTVHDSNGLIDGDGYSTLDFIWDGELRSWFYGFSTDRIIFIFDTCLAGGMNDVVYDKNDGVYNNRVVVMSSKETQSSYVYSTGKLGEGMFSRHFVNEGMLQGLADGYNQIPEEDDLVVVEEAFDYAKENFPSYLKFRQNPVISDLFTKDLLLGY